MKFDIEVLRDLQSKGIISIRQHPELPYLIHNYSARCQYERLWDETTLQCRGLITDLSGNVICRPFPKFFNLSEHEQEGSKLPRINWNQSCDVSEKIDSSLGIMYPTPDGKYRIASRGSFDSDQAVRGTAMLDHLRTDLSWYGYTYLYEIVYPENRIVVNYGNTNELVLLDAIDNRNGQSVSRASLEHTGRRLGCRVVPSVSCSKAELLALNSVDCNREGVVVRFADGMRVKIKFAEYCRLHKLITGINTKSIWESLKDGKSLDELIDRVPDEFYAWVKGQVDDFMLQYAIVESDAKYEFQAAKDALGDSPRKHYAERFQKSEERAILFLMLDRRDYSQAIWKQLKPETEPAYWSNAE